MSRPARPTKSAKTSQVCQAHQARQTRQVHQACQKFAKTSKTSKPVPSQTARRSPRRRSKPNTADRSSGSRLRLLPINWAAIMP